jgi:hypothetical protein
MNKPKTLAYILVAVLILSIGINVYQYSQNFTLNNQKNDANTKLETSSALTQLQFQINAELEKLDLSLLSACTQLSAVGLNGSQARNVLLNLAASSSLIVNAATVDANDVLVAVEPSQYSSIEGANISNQEQNIQLHETMRPAMSNTIPLVEGFDGVVMVAPIFNANGTFQGSLSIVIQPSALLNATIAPAVEGMSYTLWAMQTDGRIIYDADPAQEGKMLFSDSIYANYPELLTLGHQISSENAGYGTYQYYKTLASGQLVKKEAFWTTIGIYGTEWRLVIIHVVNA